MSKRFHYHTRNIAWNPAASSGPPAPTDPYWADVLFQMRFNGGDGSSTFTEDKGRTASPQGGAVQSSAQKRFGVSSFAPASASQYVSLTHASDFNLGTGDFTFDIWLYPTAFTGIDSIALTASDQINFYVNPTDNNYLYFYTPGGPNNSFNRALTLNRWNFVAMQRRGNTMECWTGLDTDTTAGKGVTFANNINYTNITQWLVGGEGATAWWRGYMDSIRVTKGVARYDGGSTITIPTEDWPTS